MMEVESGSHRGQTILLSARSTSTKAPTVAIAKLSLAALIVLFETVEYFDHY